MDDKYISDKKLKRLYDEMRAEARVRQLLDLTASELKKGTTENPAANAPYYTAPQWPACQVCGEQMIYLGLEKTKDETWEKFECKKCHIKLMSKKAEGGEKIWTL